MLELAAVGAFLSCVVSLVAGSRLLLSSAFLEKQDPIANVVKVKYKIPTIPTELMALPIPWRRAV